MERSQKIIKQIYFVYLNLIKIEQYNRRANE